MSSKLELQNRFRCFCNCMSVRTAAIFIGWYEIIFAVCYITSSAIFFVQYKYILPPVLIGLFIILTSLFMLQGITFNKETLILPYLVIQFFSFVSLLAILSLFIFASIKAEHYEIFSDLKLSSYYFDAETQEVNKFGLEVTLAVLIGCVSVILIMQIWFFIICIKAYRLIEATNQNDLTTEMNQSAAVLYRHESISIPQLDTYSSDRNFYSVPQPNVSLYPAVQSPPFNPNDSPPYMALQVPPYKL